MTVHTGTRTHVCECRSNLCWRDSPTAPRSCPNHPVVKVFFELDATTQDLCGPCMVHATAALGLGEWKIVERFR